MIYDQEFQPVTVDAGDLLEVCNAANGWAAVLRTRAEQKHGEGDESSAARFVDAADRIDKAVKSLREQNYR